MELPHFDVPTARQFAQEGRLEEWVHAYLTSGEWANLPFAEGLKTQQRWWRGPLKMPLSVLSRALGPEPGMEYQVSVAAWQERIAHMAQSFTDLRAIPPLIAEYRDGELSLRDGNHRHGALALKGWPTCWVIIWYNSHEDYERHDLAAV